MKIILHVTVEQWRLDIINTMHTKKTTNNQSTRNYWIIM